MLAGFIYASRHSIWDPEPRCVNCGQLYLILNPPDAFEERRFYEILVCPHCTNAATRVHGRISRFAICPRCNQRTLETPVRRLPPTRLAPVAVEVSEHCHVCAFEEEYRIPDHKRPQRQGKVLPFRPR